MSASRVRHDTDSYDQINFFREGAATWGNFRQQPKIVAYLTKNPPMADKGPMPNAVANAITTDKVGRTTKERQAKYKPILDEKARKRAETEAEAKTMEGVRNMGKPKRKSTAPPPGEKPPKARKGKTANAQPETTEAEEEPAASTKLPTTKKKNLYAKKTMPPSADSSDE